MRRTIVILWIMCLAAVGVLGIASPAAAGCVGTDRLGGVCTRNEVIYEDCVWTGGDTCHYVFVMGPVVYCAWLPGKPPCE